MSNKDRTIIKHKSFEVICYPETISKFRANNLSADKTYLTPTIFRSASKGDVAKAADLQKAFNTSDQSQCLLIILNKGEFKLTTNELRQLTEQKRREIIHYVHSSFLNPKTNLPYTLSVIETALKDSKMRVDSTQSATSQFDKHRKKFVEIIPLKNIETVHGKILIPYITWNKKGVQSHFHTSATVLKEDYDTSGVSIEISLNQQQFDSFNTKLISLTDNDFTFVSTKEAAKLSKTTNISHHLPKSKKFKSGKRRNLLG